MMNSSLALGTFEVVRAGLLAMGNIYEGAVDAGVTVMRHGAEATAILVRHRLV